MDGRTVCIDVLFKSVLFIFQKALTNSWYSFRCHKRWATETEEVRLNQWIFKREKKKRSDESHITIFSFILGQNKLCSCYTHWLPFMRIRQTSLLDDPTSQGGRKSTTGGRWPHQTTKADKSRAGLSPTQISSSGAAILLQTVRKHEASCLSGHTGSRFMLFMCRWCHTSYQHLPGNFKP